MISQEKIPEVKYTPPMSGGQEKVALEGGQSEFPSLPGEGDDKTRPRFQLRSIAFLKGCWKVVIWTPPRCRWNPEDPPKFSLGLNLLFGFVSGFFSPCRVRGNTVNGGIGHDTSCNPVRSAAEANKPLRLALSQWQICITIIRS